MCLPAKLASINGEEWAMVDNLSGGRVGLSFASGWHPNDFALRPETFANRASAVMDAVETVRRLWRGDNNRRFDFRCHGRGRNDGRLWFWLRCRLWRGCRKSGLEAANNLAISANTRNPCDSPIEPRTHKDAAIAVDILLARKV